MPDPPEPVVPWKNRAPRILPEVPAVVRSTVVGTVRSSSCSTPSDNRGEGGFLAAGRWPLQGANQFFRAAPSTNPGNMMFASLKGTCNPSLGNLFLRPPCKIPPAPPRLPPRKRGRPDVGEEQRAECSGSDRKSTR